MRIISCKLVSPETDSGIMPAICVLLIDKDVRLTRDPTDDGIVPVIAPLTDNFAILEPFVVDAHATVIISIQLSPSHMLSEGKSGCPLLSHE